MRLFASILIVCTSIFLTACGGKNGKSETWTYDFTENGCPTGKKVFSSRQAMCVALQDDAFNNYCAASSRDQFFVQNCTDQIVVTPGPVPPPPDSDGDSIHPAPGFDVQFYQEIYSFAYGASGLNMTSNAARDFADRFIALPNARVKFTCFKDAYTFAYSVNGMNLTRESAKAWAHQRCEVP